MCAPEMWKLSMSSAGRDGRSAYADLVTEDHRETWAIRSKRFRGWLRRCHYLATGKSLSAGLLRSWLDLLEARAQFDAVES